MPTFDPYPAARMLANDRLRAAQGWCAFRDLRGAIAATSDAPIPALNSLGNFTTTDDEIESLLDIGFALLRAFDCDPAVELTPLDRPASIAARLAERLLVPQSHRSWMRLARDVPRPRAPHDLQIRVATPDDVPAFALVHGGSTTWVRKLSRATTVEAMQDARNTFYLGTVAGLPVATLHLLQDGTTAGIYAVGTLRAFRKRGIASAMVARAVTDARTAGCDLICLSADTDGPAERLYTRLGFERAFESTLWVEPQRPPVPIARRKRRRRAPKK